MSRSPEVEPKNDPAINISENDHQFLRKFGRITAVCAIISSFAYVTGRSLIDYAIDNGSAGVGQELNNGIGRELDGAQADFEVLLRDQIAKESDDLQGFVDEKFQEFEDRLIEKIENGELLDQLMNSTSTTTTSTVPVAQNG